MSALTNFIISSIISFFGPLSPDQANDQNLSVLKADEIQKTILFYLPAKKADNCRASNCFQLNIEKQS